MRQAARASCAAAVIAAVSLTASVVGAGGSGIGIARAAANAASSSLDVLPFPGTPDAAPQTKIDFPAVAPSQIAYVKVAGSRSGPHPGRLSAQPSGRGSAFTPNSPFSPGERVSVHAALRSAGAATASGAPGSSELRFSFSVARPGSFAMSNASVASADTFGVASPRALTSSGAKTHSFVTEPGFTPPVVTISGRDTDTATGDIFLTAQDTGQDGPYILDHRGDLLWYRPAGQQSAFNLRVQSFAGQPVLTYWQGHIVCPPCSGKGVDPILDEHYQTIHTVTAGDGYQRQGTDLHEFTLGREGSEPTAFVTVWSPVRANLTSVGGPPNGTVFDWIIQEIDVNTNQVIWEWHALGHVPIKDSYARYIPGQPFDYFHLNSIQQLSNGQIIVSARDTWAVYSINKTTGKIIWQLGGKHSSFKMGSGTRFEWQHDATLHSNGLLTLFDDAGGPGPQPESQSRALELHISLANHQATLLHAYTHQPAVRAASMGSTELLFNRNVFVGWGNEPYFSEYTPSGKEVFGGSFGPGVTSYRAYRFGNWVGSPLQPPAIAVRKSSTAGRDAVYASWNGATTVAKWQVLGSASANGPFSKVGAAVPWTSFQATITVPASAGPYFEVEALNGSGHLLSDGTSVVAKAP